MILLPTRNRVDNLKRWIDAYIQTDAKAFVCLIFDPDDEDKYTGVQYPAHWVRYTAEKPRDIKAALNGAVNQLPNCPYYGCMADDFLPRVKGWDSRLIEAAGKHNLAWCDDGIHQDRLCTHPYIGGDLVRAWGWYVPPYIKRGYADFIWRDFAHALNVERYIPEMLLEHMHWQVGKAKYDTTYAMQPSVKADEQCWQGYRVSEQFKIDVQNVKEKLGI